RADDPSALIRRSVWLATPLVTGAFVLGTASVLVFVKPDSIDLIAPLTQVLSRGMTFAGISGPVVTVAIALIVLTRLGQGLLVFNATVRLPMVAGWDHLLPPWFTRLHPKYRTPLGSIAAIGASVLVMALLANLGSRSQEAFQLVQNGSGIFYALAYL